MTADPPRPITYEEMLAEVQAQRRARLALRRMMQDEGALTEPVMDRRQRLLETMETFIAKCIVRRAEISQLLRGVVVAPVDDRGL